MDKYMDGWMDAMENKSSSVKSQSLRRSDVFNECLAVS